MSIVYKITNLKNQKVYIGKTSYTLAYRWQQHVSASFSDPNKQDYNYLLHKAIRKYGVESFSVEVVEDCDDSSVNEREVYWIKYYNSCILDGCEHGYNMTYGGEGATKIPIEKIEKLWLEGKGSKEIANILGAHDTTIKKRLLGLKSYDKQIDYARNTGITIYQYDNKGKLVGSFPSISYAAKMVGIDASIINKCCNGLKKSAAGFYWSYKEDAVFEPSDLKTWQSYTILQKDLNGRIVNKFPSLSAAARAMGKKQSRLIKECCDKKREEVYGFLWSYDSERSM